MLQWQRGRTGRAISYYPDMNTFMSVVQGVATTVALGLSVYNTVRQGREHRWKRLDREDEQKRRAWCLEMVAALKDVRVPLMVNDDKREWALWGEKNGYFVITKSAHDGAMELHLVEGKEWLDQELMRMLG